MKIAPMLRNGYTLLEVLIAAAVLLLGLTVVFSITRSAQRQSAAAANLAAAQLACQTALNELLAQQLPIKPVVFQAVEGLPDWRLSVMISPSSRPELYVLHVNAQKFTPQGVPTGAAYQLFRWVPQFRVELPQENNSIEETDFFNDLFQ
jgi:prepilin-type N-terminal cleavage/methylation domain-containing protein